MRKILISFGALTLMTSCGAGQGAAALKKKSTEFTFEVSTTPCFGTCPVYDLTIKESGLAVYNGKNFPKTNGEVFKNLPDAEMDSLREVLAASNFFELDSVYDEPTVTDLPSTTMTLTINESSSKTVMGRYETPEEFDRVKAFIERLRRRNFEKK